jgi:hypothetical protein
MGSIMIVVGVVLLMAGIIWLYGIMFSRNVGLGFVSIVVPILLLGLLLDEEGLKAWGCTALGAILSVVGFMVYNGVNFLGT